MDDFVDFLYYAELHSAVNSLLVCVATISLRQSFLTVHACQGCGFFERKNLACNQACLSLFDCGSSLFSPRNGKQMCQHTQACSLFFEGFKMKSDICSIKSHLNMTVSAANILSVEFLPVVPPLFTSDVILCGFCSRGIIFMVLWGISSVTSLKAQAWNTRPATADLRHCTAVTSHLLQQFNTISQVWKKVFFCRYRCDTITIYCICLWFKKRNGRLFNLVDVNTFFLFIWHRGCVESLNYGM